MIDGVNDTNELPTDAQIPHARSVDAFWRGVHDVGPGDAVRIRDAAGEWHRATADSRVERGHKFPILWVSVVGRNGQTCRLPWPIEAVGAPNDLAPRRWRLPSGEIVGEAVNREAVELLKSDPDEYFRRTRRQNGT